MQGEGNTGPGPYLCPQEGKGRTGDALYRAGTTYSSFQPRYVETGEPLSDCLVLGAPPQWSFVTSVLSSPFCIPSSAVQTLVLNPKFYFLGS